VLGRFSLNFCTGGGLRCLESDAAMRAITERLRNRAAAAAQRKNQIAGFHFFAEAVGIAVGGNQIARANGPLHPQGPALAYGNFYLSHGFTSGFLKGATNTALYVSQYLGTEGSTSSDQARMPPLRFQILRKPACCRNCTASADRLPLRQCATISRELS